MFKKSGQFFRSMVLVLMIVSQPFAALGVSAAQGSDFVKQAGPEFRLHGRVFRFAGSNNYYLIYKSKFMVDDVLNAAAAQGFRVMRVWGAIDIGNQDGSNSIRGKADGVYTQYWDGSAPAYNDGDDGLKHLDYVIYKAGKLGIKLVIPFVNNWNDFGGMDQYVRWRGGQYHDEFYTDPLIRTWYKNWITHLLERTNTYNGLKYKNDPTIMTWELANEPRCLSAGAYPRSPNCTTQTLIAWADEMSTYIKTIDDKHLVSVGDEGFYCVPNPTDWTENCGEGVDTLAFASLENIGVMSFHLYPDLWGKDVAWGTQWIQRHFQDARALDKPAMLGEFGLHDKSMRNPNYKTWTDTVFNNGGAGALYWILSGKQDDGSLYPDYDGFTVSCPSPVCSTISNFGAMMKANRELVFPPVADVDTAVTEFNTPVTLNASTNDIAYGSATTVLSSLDLDPSASGQQTTFSVAAGTFVAYSNGTVTFTPNDGFSGTAQASYTIQDSASRTSNIATLIVTVKPNPTAAIPLATFETSTEGWAPGNWQPTAGSVEQSADYASQGSYSLKVTTVDGGWFGVSFGVPVNLTGKTHIKFEIKTLATGTSMDAAIQVGANWEWCQGPFTFINSNTTTTVDIDLLNLSCALPNLSQVNGMYIFFSGGGIFYVDNVRAE
jgi:mannan endo-1,4-beta-mannosidase